MGQGKNTDLGAALLALVPTDGSTIGNKALRKRLATEMGRQIDETEYFAAHQVLVDADVLVKGKGRGGSVKRASASSGAKLDIEAQEIPMAAKQPKPQQATLPVNPHQTGTTRRKRASENGAKVLAYRHQEKRKNNPSTTAASSRGRSSRCRFDRVQED